MTVIHAYRRVKPYTYTVPGVATLEFLPNERGDVVCDVPTIALVDKLLAVPTGFREYAPAPLPKPDTSLLQDEKGGDKAPVENKPERYVLVAGDGSSIDLRPMTDEELRAFADANGISVHHKAKGDTIRDKIVDALAVKE